MFLPSLRASTVGSFKRPPSGPAADVTPNTPIANNGVWCDTEVDATYIEDYWYTFTNEQITGISTTITLKVEYANTGMQLYYKKNHSSTSKWGNDNICDNDFFRLDMAYGAYNFTGNGWTAINNNGTFTVVNNDWVGFACERKAGNRGGGELVTLKNQSDGNAVLGTFYATYNGNI